MTGFAKVISVEYINVVKKHLASVHESLNMHLISSSLKYTRLRDLSYSVHPCMRCIQNTVKHQKWSVLQKKLTTKSHWVYHYTLFSMDYFSGIFWSADFVKPFNSFCRSVSSMIIDRILNTHLKTCSLHKICEITGFHGPVFSLRMKNKCPHTGECGSMKTRILAYFMQRLRIPWHINEGSFGKNSQWFLSYRY